MWYFFAAVGVYGHLAICIWIINRIHATALPHWFVKGLDLIWYGFLFGLPAGTLAWIVFRPGIRLLSWDRIDSFCILYGSICSCAAVFTTIVWYRYLSQLEITERLISNHTEVVNVRQKRAKLTSSLIHTAIASLPGNQVFQLGIHRKTIKVPGLPKPLDGMTITHLSDLHFTGRVHREYFLEVIERANELRSDFVVITGDIVDKPKCLPWLNDILGQLKSRHGVLFVLGNHDLRIHDESAVRNRMTENGHIDLGGRYAILSHNGYPIFFAGNELPWFSRATNMSECPQRYKGKRPFRIALSHSPDQIEWARRFDIDLMLAGHTHGGQIRFPGIGPVFAPSWYGVKFASGTFYEKPTLLHVSRGLSGTRLLRINCRPELTQLVLQAER